MAVSVRMGDRVEWRRDGVLMGVGQVVGCADDDPGELLVVGHGSRPGWERGAFRMVREEELTALADAV